MQNGETTDDTTVITAQQSDVVPVYIHDITLDSTSNFEMAESVYNYLFYGLNSAKTYPVITILSYPNKVSSLLPTMVLSSKVGLRK